MLVSAFKQTKPWNEQLKVGALRKRHEEKPTIVLAEWRVGMNTSERKDKEKQQRRYEREKEFTLFVCSCSLVQERMF